MQTNPLKSAFVLSALLIVLAILYRTFVPTTSVLPEYAAGKPVPGKEGSEHAHATMYIMIEDEVVDFCEPKYMLRNPIAHFEDNRCDTIHKHARGVSYEYFLTTIGVRVSDTCIVLPTGKRYCKDEKNRVVAVLNGKEMSLGKLSFAEIKNFDHLLIYYGADTGADLLFNYNQVPDVPMDVNLPRGAVEMQNESGDIDTMFATSSLP